MTGLLLRFMLVNLVVLVPVLASNWPKSTYGPKLVPFVAVLPLGFALALKYLIAVDAASLSAAGEAQAAAARQFEASAMTWVGIVSGLGVLGVVLWRTRSARLASGGSR